MCISLRKLQRQKPFSPVVLRFLAVRREKTGESERIEKRNKNDIKTNGNRCRRVKCRRKL